MELKNLKYIIRAVVGRLVLLSFIFLTIWRVVEVSGPQRWSIVALAGLIIIEGIWRCVRCLGKEGKWVSFCIVFFLVAAIPQIWILQLEYIEYLKNPNQTSVYKETFSLVSTGIYFGPQEWVQVFEQLMVLTMIIVRVVIPSNNMSHHQLSELLLIYIAIGSDIVEFFEPFYDKGITSSPDMPYILLGIWTLSTSQFACTLNAKRTGVQAFSEKDVRAILSDERWSITFSLICQEIPFFGIRVHLMHKYKIISYGIMFFTVKNACVVLFQVYRFLVLTLCKDNKAEDDDDIEEGGRLERNNKVSPVVD